MRPIILLALLPLLSSVPRVSAQAPAANPGDRVRLQLSRDAGGEAR